jgi:hypothetical protein
MSQIPATLREMKQGRRRSINVVLHQGSVHVDARERYSDLPDWVGLSTQVALVAARPVVIS